MLNQSTTPPSPLQVLPYRDFLTGRIMPVSLYLQGKTCRRCCPISKPPNYKHFQIHRRHFLINSTKTFRHNRNMGLWLEVKEKVMCHDSECLARAILEIAFEKVGIKIDTETEKMIEEHVERLGKLISDRRYDDPYTFTMGHLKISVYDIKFDVVECHLEGCEGYVAASINLDGNINTMREIAKAIIRSMGIDKYVKCE
jgi:hypothetical protein